MTEIYLAYDNVSDPRLRCSVSPLLSACCPLICMLSYTVIIPYARILFFSKPSQKYLLVFVSQFNIISKLQAIATRSGLLNSNLF